MWRWPSWNFRNLYANLDYNPGPACSCAYELAVRNPTNGAAETFALSPGGGAAYLLMGVPVAGPAAQLAVQSDGSTPPATTLMTVFRRK